MQAQNECQHSIRQIRAINAMLHLQIDVLRAYWATEERNTPFSGNDLKKRANFDRQRSATRRLLFPSYLSSAHFQNRFLHSEGFSFLRIFPLRISKTVSFTVHFDSGARVVK